MSDDMSGLFRDQVIERQWLPRSALGVVRPPT
jgi:hypothetical protein